MINSNWPKEKLLIDERLNKSKGQYYFHKPADYRQIASNTNLFGYPMLIS